jgi:hypothetical protein
MNLFLKIILLTLLALSPVILSTSCSKEDDLDEIFRGKTWYITGGCVGGKVLNTEVKELYTHADSYYITFGETTFTGKLAADTFISGAWKANGKERTMSITVDEFSNPSGNELSAQLHSILRMAHGYSGDANILSIEADAQNFIRLRTTKM